MKKPEPLEAAILRNLCPVCGKASYSRGGTHPQCALARADAELRAKRLAAGIVVPRIPARSSWMKSCPQCKRLMPARRYACDCGHEFGTAGAPAQPGSLAAMPASANTLVTGSETRPRSVPAKTAKAKSRHPK